MAIELGHARLPVPLSICGTLLQGCLPCLAEPFERGSEEGGVGATELGFQLVYMRDQRRGVANEGLLHGLEVGLLGVAALVVRCSERRLGLPAHGVQLLDRFDPNGIWRGLEREVVVELVLARESIRE
jgi:hypothetical protein